jgi:uncharacterized protein
MSPTAIAEISCLAVAIGLLMGIIGGGGGGIYLIVLIAALRMPAAEAVGASLALSAITLAGAAIQYWIAGFVRKDYLAVLAVAGVAGVLTGSLVLKGLPESTLVPAIVVVFVLSGASSLIKVGKGSAASAEPRPARERIAPLSAVGAVSGLLSGVLGLSGTTPLTSLLIGAFDVEPRAAVGTTTLVTLAISAAGGAFRLGAGAIDLRLILIFGLGSVLGSTLGARLARRIDRRAITAAVAVLAIGSGLFLALKR